MEVLRNLLDLLLLGFEPLLFLHDLLLGGVSLLLNLYTLVELLGESPIAVVAVLEGQLLLALGLLLVEDGLFFVLDGILLAHRQMRSRSWTYRLFHQCPGLGLGEPFHLQCPALSHLALTIPLAVLMQLGLLAFAQPLASVDLPVAVLLFDFFACFHHYLVSFKI